MFDISNCKVFVVSLLPVHLVFVEFFFAIVNYINTKYARSRWAESHYKGQVLGDSPGV